jgi:hypothetical protein
MGLTRRRSRCAAEGFGLDKIGSAAVTSGHLFATRPPRTARAGGRGDPQRRDSARAQFPQARLRLVNQPVARRVLVSVGILLLLPLGQGSGSLPRQGHRRGARPPAPPPPAQARRVSWRGAETATQGRGCGNNARHVPAGDARGGHVLGVVGRAATSARRAARLDPGSTPSAVQALSQAAEKGPTAPPAASAAAGGARARSRASCDVRTKDASDPPAVGTPRLAGRVASGPSCPPLAGLSSLGKGERLSIPIGPGVGDP